MTSGYDIKKLEGDELGTYELASLDSIGMVELKITPSDQNVKKYKVLTNEGKVLGKDLPVEITKSIRYLPLISGSLSDLTVELMSDEGEVIARGRFDEANGVIRTAIE